MEAWRYLRWKLERWEAEWIWYALGLDLRSDSQLGEFCWSTGNKYVGNWLNDEKSGEGIFYWANGDVYDGHWLVNKKNGTLQPCVLFLF